MSCRDQGGLQPREGVGRGRSRRTRSQTRRFREVAGKDRRLSRRREPTPPNSVDPGLAGFPIG